MTTTQQIKLPPLPEAMHCDIQLGVHSGQLAYYSQVQILAYGQLCREQALEDAREELRGMTTTSPIARTTLRECVEALEELK